MHPPDRYSTVLPTITAARNGVERRKNRRRSKIRSFMIYDTYETGKKLEETDSNPVSETETSPFRNRSKGPVGACFVRQFPGILTRDTFSPARKVLLPPFCFLLFFSLENGVREPISNIPDLQPAPGQRPKGRKLETPRRRNLPLPPNPFSPALSAASPHPIGSSIVIVRTALVRVPERLLTSVMTRTT